MFSHLIHAFCVEALLAGQAGHSLSAIVIAFYLAQRMFLEEHLVQSALSCIEPVARSLGLDVTEAALSIIHSVQFFLPNAAGGSEAQIAFLS